LGEVPGKERPKGEEEEEDEGEAMEGNATSMELTNKIRPMEETLHSLNLFTVTGRLDRYCKASSVADPDP
jgi:hypothetical protein